MGRWEGSPRESAIVIKSKLGTCYEIESRAGHEQHGSLHPAEQLGAHRKMLACSRQWALWETKQEVLEEGHVPCRGEGVILIFTVTP